MLVSLSLWVLTNNASVAQAPTTLSGNELILVERNSVLAKNNPALPYKSISYGGFTGFQDISTLKELVRENTLLNCLIQRESGWNIKAIGKENEIGILQFKSETFYYYAEQYGFYDFEISNPEHQIKLAKVMLEDNLNYHWTTFNQCQNLFVSNATSE